MRTLWIALAAAACAAGPRHGAAAMDDGARLVGLTAEVGKPVVIFALPADGSSRVEWTTSSRLVLDALLPALGTTSRFEVELEHGSKEIHRVNAYAFDPTLVDIWRGAYVVSRIATQRNNETKEEHLEAFLTDRAGKETAYNVEDPMLQAVVTAVFRSRAMDVENSERMHLDVEVSDGTIVKVKVGQQP